MTTIEKQHFTKQSDVALEQASVALTHSDTNTSIARPYVNKQSVIQIPIGEIAYRKLSQKIQSGMVSTQKKTFRKTNC